MPSFDFANRVVRQASRFGAHKAATLFVVCTAVFIVSIYILATANFGVQSQLGTYTDPEVSTIISAVHSPIVSFVTSHPEAGGDYNNSMVIHSAVVVPFAIASYVQSYLPDCGIGQGCFLLTTPTATIQFSASYAETNSIWSCSIHAVYSDTILSVTRTQLASSPNRCWWLRRSDVPYESLRIESFFSQGSLPIITTITNNSRDADPLSNNVTIGFGIYNAAGSMPSGAIAFFNQSELASLTQLQSMWTDALYSTPAVNVTAIKKSIFEILSSSIAFVGTVYTLVHAALNWLETHSKSADSADRVEDDRSQKRVPLHTKGGMINEDTSLQAYQHV